jgi:hypothetical protein
VSACYCESNSSRSARAKDLALSSAVALFKARISISYSRTDLAFAESLVATLSSRKFEAYLDREDILPGEPWESRLHQLILEAAQPLQLSRKALWPQSNRCAGGLVHKMPTRDPTRTFSCPLLRALRTTFAQREFFAF